MKQIGQKVRLRNTLIYGVITAELGMNAYRVKLENGNVIPRFESELTGTLRENFKAFDKKLELKADEMAERFANLLIRVLDGKFAYKVIKVTLAVIISYMLVEFILGILKQLSHASH